MHRVMLWGAVVSKASEAHPERMRPVHPQVQEVSSFRAWRKNIYQHRRLLRTHFSPGNREWQFILILYQSEPQREQPSKRRETLRQNTQIRKKRSWMLVSSVLPGTELHQPEGASPLSGVPLCFLTLSFWAGVPCHRSCQRDCQLYFYFPIVKKWPFSIILQLLLRAQVISLTSLLAVLLWNS